MPTTTYATLDGVILSEDRNGTQRNYVPDTLGNTTMLTDSTGVTDTFEFWPYGEVRTRTGTNATNFQYVGTLGYCKVPQTAVTYVRARMYMASRGRWTSVDPLWPVFAPYEYATNKPQCKNDSSGLYVAHLIAIGGFTKSCVVNFILMHEGKISSRQFCESCTRGLAGALGNEIGGTIGKFIGGGLGFRLGGPPGAIICSEIGEGIGALVCDIFFQERVFDFARTFCDPDKKVQTCKNPKADYVDLVNTRTIRIGGNLPRQMSGGRVFYE